MDNATNIVQGKHIDSLAAASKRYVLAEILDVTSAVTAELANISDIEFVEGTHTSSTNAWTGVTADSTLKKGKVIVYKLPYASNGSSVTLNLTLAGGTKTGAKAVYRYASTRLKSEYGANYYIPLIYNGSYWFAFADYGTTTNYYDRMRIANAIAVASGAVAAQRFVGTTDGHAYKELGAGSTFDIRYPIYYNVTAVADAASMSTGLYTAYPSATLTTTLDDENRTFAAQMPLYLKGTLNGKIFTVHSDVLTTTVPSTADGFTYYFVGQTYSTTQAYIYLERSEFFTFVDGSFQPINTNYIETPSASMTLDTVPATVNGGMWFEVSGGEPTVKFYYGGNSYSLTTTIDEIDPQLTLSPGAQTISGTAATINVSYLGNGTVTVSARGIAANHSPSYSNGVITLPYNQSEAAGGGNVTVTAGLSASSPYTAATATAMVYMNEAAGGDTPSSLDEPMTIIDNLTEEPFEGDTYYGTPFSITVTYPDSGLSVSAVDSDDNDVLNEFVVFDGEQITCDELPENTYVVITISAEGFETTTITVYSES